MDFSQGHHLYLEILPNAGDSWVDMNGNPITQLSIAQCASGTGNPLCIYDFDLDVGELDRSIDDFPKSTVQKVSDFKFTISGIWNDSSRTTANVLWLLEGINSEYGKSFNVIGRTVKLWVSNSINAGLIYQSDASVPYTFLNYSGRFWSGLSSLAIPTFNEQAQLLFTGVIEEIDFGGSDGRIGITCTDLIEDKILGTAVPDTGANGKPCIPITYGDFSVNPMPALIESDMRNLMRVWLGDASTPHVSFDRLAIYDETYDCFWNLANTYQQISNNNEIEFTANYQGLTQPFNLTTETDDFYFASETYSALMPSDDMQKVLTVGTENVGLHTSRLPPGPFPVANTTQQGTYSAYPMQSRGWGNTVRTGHVQGSPYKVADVNLQAGLLTLDVTLTPTKIYDASSLAPPWGGYPNGDAGWDITQNLLMGGDPWAVIQNSVTGGAIANPIVISSKNNAIFAINSCTGYAQPMLIVEFPDLSSYGGTLVSSALYIDGEYRSSHTCLPATNVTGMYFGLGDHYGSSCELMAEGTVAHDKLYTYAKSPLVPSQMPSDIASLAKLTIISFLDWDYSYANAKNGTFPATTQPFLLLNAIKIQATITVPIKTTSKLFAFGWGRQPQNITQGFNYASRIIGDLYFRNFGVLINGTLDTLLLDFSVTEQVGFRSLIKDLAQAGLLSITTDATGAPIANRLLSHSDLGTTPRIIGDDDVILADRNLPDLTYSIPSKSTVYSRFELNYGWDYARKKYTSQLVADGLVNDYGYSGIDEIPYDAISDWSSIITTTTAAQSYIGQMSVNTYSLSSKYIQSHVTAAALFHFLVAWLATPRMSVQVALDYAKAQDISLLQYVMLSVSGLPSKVTSKAWVVTGIADNLQPTSMTRTLSLTEIPATF